MPCLLVLEGHGVSVPTGLNVLEDWVRPPISREDFGARRAALAARAQAGALPCIDREGVLRFGGRRLSLSPAEADLMRVLVESFQEVVSRESLVRRVWPGDCAQRRNALDLRILRLRRRIGSLHLSIRTAWGRGYLLDIHDPREGDLVWSSAGGH
ncbi:winged helix-turn-helix domain-containing protein [Embleya sp. NPDC008237]|uniref:winged helix-turn-helix domain-containing protein n=1 Tax=unclassified Embleya TaxID=2699296 RepID=UPI0036E2E02C